MTTTTFHPAVPAPSRTVRLLCVGAVAATVPYAGLKLAWLAGSRVGLVDAGFGDSTAMRLGNTLTFALDLCGAALAVVFATRRGASVPACLTVFPMWVGYGLLGQILVLVPVTLLRGTVGSQPADGGGPIAGWVYGLVYLGFTGLGLCLLPAFAAYARRRWADRLARPVAQGRRDRVLMAAAGATALCAVAPLIGATVLGGQWWVTLGVDAILAAVATGGLLPLGLARGRGTVWRPLLAAYTGTGALFAWGLFHTVLETVPNDLVPQHPPTIAVVYSVARLAVGVAGGLALRRWWVAADSAATGLSRR